MKTYNFTVTTNFEDNSKGFMQEILGEVNNEKQQLELSKTINRETSEQHREILSKFMEPINEQLEQIDLQFVKVDMPDTAGANDYSIHRYKATIADYDLNIELVPTTDREFKDSMYTTYTGAYKIKLTGRGNFTVNSPGEALAHMRETIKRHVSEYRVFSERK